jgi:hypothetical protein
MLEIGEELTMKVVINRCFGGFGLSLAALQAYANRKGITLYFYRQTKYEFREGVTEYERVDDAQSSLFAHAHRADHGAVFDGKCSNEDCYYYPEIPRNDHDLIAVVTEMGEAANGECAKLAIIEIPDGVEFEISEYDGNEHLAEAHRTWR